MQVMRQLIILLLLHVASAAAQTPFSHSMHPGDRRAYRLWSSVINNDSAVCARTIMDVAGDSADLGTVAGDIIPVPGLLFDYWGNLGPGRWKIDADGWLHEETRSNDWRKLYPLTPPPMDTVTFIRPPSDTVQAILLRRYEMPLFDTTVRAFDLRMTEGAFVMDLVIAERFGLVSARVRLAQSTEANLRLLNATLDGHDYNGERRSFDFLPLCTGDVRHYQYSQFDPNDPSHGEKRNVIESIGQDTLINGERYYRVTNPAAYSQPRRSATDGVHFANPAGDEIVLPANATLGTVCLGGLVVSDTSTIDFWGQFRRRIVVSRVWIDISETMEWIEGVGLFLMQGFGHFSGFQSTVLVYANLCGIPYGTPLSQAVPCAAAPARIEEIFPNPARHDDAVTVLLILGESQSLFLTVHDALGRQLANIDLGRRAPGTHAVAVPSSPIPPGLRVCHLVANGRVIAQRRFIVN